MSTVFKYPLTLGSSDVMLPAGAKLLTVQIQDGVPMLWALVDPRQPKTRTTIDVYGTGREMPADPGDYISTFQMLAGALVWHAFASRSAA